MNTNNLMTEIELLRQEMIVTGMKKGLTSPETLQLSHKLDKLLNQLTIKPLRKLM